MKLSELKQFLSHNPVLQIELPDGSWVPAHFHITEIGLIQKHYIDCGGTVRKEQAASLQIWVSGDTEHRLTANKLAGIIEQSDSLFDNLDPDMEAEYQQATIGKFGMEIQGSHLRLTSRFTDCLAKDHCGIPPEKMKRPLTELIGDNTTSCCTPGGGCC
ncbi:MAG: hypothetical protein RIQ62_75 [Bacteroidota bacterium]|jgi:hypothetical protein